MTSAVFRVGNFSISQLRIARLEKIGFEWTDLKRSAWEDKIKLLKEFVNVRKIVTGPYVIRRGTSFHVWRLILQEFGHTRVPATLDTPKYPKLGSWVKSQRKGYRNQKIADSGGTPRSKERIAVRSYIRSRSSLRGAETFACISGVADCDA